MFEILSKSPVFRGLPAPEIELLFNQINYSIKKYAKNEIVALRDEKCESLMILLKGSVKGEMLDFSGKVIKIEDIQAPRPLASAFLFGEKNKFPVDIVTLEEIELLIISKQSVVKLLQNSTIVLRNFMDAISNRSQFLSAKLWFLSFKTIREKMTQYLLELSKPDKSRITLPKSQQELAEYFGVTRPSFARVISDMEKEGLIETQRRDILIKDRARLIKILN